MEKRLIFNTPYHVDSFGKVWKGNKKMKSYLNKNGYRQIGLVIDGKQKQYKISRLVAQHFLNNPLDKSCVNHINGIKCDDRIENLEWVTHSENMIHAYKNKLHLGTRGIKNGRAKLNEEQIKWIRENYIPYDRNFGIQAISSKLNMGYKTIYRIIKNQSWKNGK